VMEQMIEGSEFIMNRRIQHQDFSPSNIFLMGRSEYSADALMKGHQNIAIGDMDLLRSVTDIIEIRGDKTKSIIIGNTNWMAPEKFIGSYETFLVSDSNILPLPSLRQFSFDGVTFPFYPVLREDSYSMGVVLYNLQFSEGEASQPFVDFFEAMIHSDEKYQNMDFINSITETDWIKFTNQIQNYLLKDSIARNQFRTWLSARYELSIAENAGNSAMIEDLKALKDNTINLLSVDPNERLPGIISPTLESEYWGGACS